MITDNINQQQQAYNELVARLKAFYSKPAVKSEEHSKEELDVVAAIGEHVRNFKLPTSETVKIYLLREDLLNQRDKLASQKTEDQSNTSHKSDGDAQEQASDQEKAKNQHGESQGQSAGKTITDADKEIDFDNLYDNNHFDVRSLDDIVNATNINLLAKQDDKYLLFEFADDFWKFEDGKLTQYPDFVSLRDSKGGVDATLTPHGVAIIDAIQNNPAIKEVANFTLKDRDSYIKGQVSDEQLSIPFRGVKKDMDSIGKLLRSDNKSKELEEAFALTNAVIDVLALVFAMSKASILTMNRKKLTDDILHNLSTKNASDHMKNAELMKEVPALRNAFSALFEYTHKISIDDKYKSMSPMEKINAVLNYAITNKDVYNGIEGFANTPFFKKQLSELSTGFTDFVQEMQGEFPNFTDYLRDNDLAAVLYGKGNGGEGNFTELLKELDIDHKNNGEVKDFLAAMHFFRSSSKNAPEPTNDYYASLMRFFPTRKDMHNIDRENVKNIIAKIADKILKLDIEEEKKQAAGMKI